MGEPGDLELKSFVVRRMGPTPADRDPVNTTSLPVTTSSKTPSLSEANLPRGSRRRFLRNLSIDCATALGTAYLTQATLDLFTVSRPKQSADTEVFNERRYPNTNETTTFPSGLSFHNLGVKHWGLRFMLDRETIINAIKASQVVMLEGCAGEEYFDFLSAMAHQEEKTVFRLESGKAWIHRIGYSASPAVNGFVSLVNVRDFFDRSVIWFRQKLSQRAAPSENNSLTNAGGKARPVNLEPSRFNLVVTGLAAANQAAFGIGHSTRKFNEGSDYYPSDDRSFTVDGRTVLLLKDIERVLGLLPNVKVLVITGDLHATGFKYYTSSPERFAEFKQRAELYEKIYRSWLGGSPRPEMDPVLKGEETPYGS